MKNVLFLFLFCTIFCISNVNAQEAKYTIHTIVKGETLSQLAKKYHTSVGDIMRFNSMNSKSQLKIGEKIKIPASSNVATKKTAKTPVTTKPISKPDSAVATHYVMKNETLFSISKKFRVSVEQLKEWNNLTDEHIHFGQQLAVSPDGAVSLAEKKNKKATRITDTAVSAKKTTIITDTAVSATAKPPVATSDLNPASSNNISTQTNNASTGAFGDSSDSYFAKDFLSQNKSLKSVMGYATIFKTSNGWQDKKYYIFMNGVPLGTVVKVSTPNGNSVYAKVLWTLDTTINYGYNFRINDAAASALAINEQAFSLKVEYHQ